MATALPVPVTATRTAASSLATAARQVVSSTRPITAVRVIVHRALHLPLLPAEDDGASTLAPPSTRALVSLDGGEQVRERVHEDILIGKTRLISRPGVRSRPLTPVCVAGHCFGRQPGVQLRVHAAAAGFERQAASAAYSRRAHRRCVYWQHRIDAHRMRSTHPAVPERVRGMAMNQSLGDDRAARP